MRPEPNKEIDLLLRQLARRDGAPASEIEEQHLDADELNSYVANALPAAARARYTEHLADCSSCRKLVVQLSAAEGVVAVQQSTPAVAPSGLKSFLASLFSPMVLRYAVPALGLIVMAVIGVVVFRQDQKGADVARLSDTDQNKSVLQSPAETSVTASASPANTEGRAGLVRPAANDALAPVAKEQGPAPVVANQPADAAAPAAEPPPAAPKAVSTETEERSKLPLQKEKEDQKEKKAEAPQPTSGDVDTAKQRAEEAAKDRVSKLHDASIPGATVERRDVRPAKPATGAGTGSVASASPTGTTGREYNRARDKQQAETFSSSAETRSVAGRRFRKSGGVWIDTAYNSSSEVTNVARGSEQYRALIADEPSIRTIAEELDGVIIVVWKGRTYRIR